MPSIAIIFCYSFLSLIIGGDGCKWSVSSCCRTVAKVFAKTEPGINAQDSAVRNLSFSGVGLGCPVS